MTVWTPLQNEMLRDLWADGMRRGELARVFNTTPGAIAGQAIRLQLHSASEPKRVAGLANNHPAVTGARSLFPKAVTDPPPPRPWGNSLNEGGHVLKSGANQRKLGAVVEKGAWRGMPIFSLSLEERATCPQACENWSTCYGNGMPFATRYRHGPALERALDHDLAGLQAKFPRGFVVRLHLLGDFYSEAYLDLWSGWLDRFPALRVFGYTAWDWLTPIGAAIGSLAFRRWDRFAVRLSSPDPGVQRAVTLREVPDGTGWYQRHQAGVIVCPAQLGKTLGCSTCGLCWAPAARCLTIGFLAHGPAWGRK